ncbi:MAG TPA: hypothetical protein VMY39_09815, partial [Planctomycetota bacterium]|nr:hypothetical protein [Planctomycetota bacterium]
LKVYDTEIYIDGDAGDLRAGMSCNAQILVAEYDDAVYVPIQSVVRIAGKPAVIVAGRNGPERRDVEIGLDNGQMVHILSGLEEGEKVLLAPPLGESVAPVTGGIAPESETPPETTSDEKGDQKGTALPIDPEKLRNMSREERTKFYESLTPEQREQLRQSGGGTRRRRPGTDAGKDAAPPAPPGAP